MPLQEEQVGAERRQKRGRGQYMPRYLKHLVCKLQVAAEELVDAKAVQRQRLPADYLQLHADVVVPADRSGISEKAGSLALHATALYVERIGLLPVIQVVVQQRHAEQRVALLSGTRR